MSPRKANPTPLDVLSIVFTSVTLLLLLLWVATSIAGQTMFNNVPMWLQTMIASVWAKVSVAGGSLGAFLLRRYFDKSPTPNYLLWIPGFTMFLLLALVLVQIVVRHTGPPPVRLANLLFNVDKRPNPSFQQKHIPDLDFWAQSPVEVPVHGVYAQPNGNPRYPYAEVLEIRPKQSSTAYIKMTVDTSQASGPSQDYDYKICLHPASSQPNGDKPSGLLRCENGFCSPAQGEDPGYVETCDTHSARSAGLVPVAFADEPAAQTREAGWVVPSLDTLEKMTDRERVGFTRFDVSFTPNETLAEADRYYFMLRVNERPVYINGLLPERIHYTIEKEKTNVISFALENLNFTGQYEGYEKLQLSVFFQQGDRLVRRQDLERKYVALRDAPEVALPSELGTFRWSGTYVVPKNENKYEISLASSGADAAPALAAKARFDKAKLTFKEKPVVMVVRPPLRQPPSYGLVLGVVQPTSQVQFTFNAAEASDLCQWATGQVGKGTGGKLIQPNLRRYEVATRGYSACH